MELLTRTKLSFMMFLEYFIWGAWYVTLGNYLFANFEVTAIQVGSAYANLCIAAIVSPFFIGLMADRYFSAQKVLGTLHLLGGSVLFVASYTTDFNTLWWLILAYTVMYMPTIAIANSISFKALKDAGKEFPLVRAFGTAGWICAGLLLGFANLESSSYTFMIAGTASLILGVYSFILPDTPCNKNSAQNLSSLLGMESLQLFRDRSYLTFFLCSIAVCIPLSFYYSFSNSFLNDIGMQNSASKMTLGQVSEFLFMLLIPFMFRRYGVKIMLLAGVFAWIARYLLFAYGDNDQHVWMLLGGIVLHGICYDFFFVTGQIYTDKKAGANVKNAAQGLLTFATYGIGMLIGSYISGLVTQYYAIPGDTAYMYEWKQVWLVPAYFSIIIFCIILFFFRDPRKAERNSC